MLNCKEDKQLEEKMATVREHYDHVLSDVYSWMFGGFDSGIESNINCCGDGE